MKKILALSAIVLATAASAQSVAIKYDGQKVNDVTANNHEVMVGYVSDKTAGFGYEAFAVSDSGRGQGSNTQATGFEVAGTYQLPSVAKIIPVARLGYGQKAVDGGSNVSYWTVGLDGRVPTGTPTTFLVGFKHRIGVNTGDLFRSNQISAGAEYALSKRWTIEGRLAHTNGDGYVANGITGGLSYAF